MMKDSQWNEIFSESAQEEIIFHEAGKRVLFVALRDLYEAARRRALDVDRKLSGVTDLLDKI